MTTEDGTFNNTTLSDKVENGSSMNAFEAFDKMFKPVYGYLAISICVCGITANILNTMVLTRRSMISAVHLFLTGLAISDGLTMTIYVPYLVQMYLLHGIVDSLKRNTEEALTYQLIFAVTSVALHSVSIWLTVTLAVFRYLFIRFPRIVQRHGNVKSAIKAIAVVVFVVVTLCIPNSIVYKLENTTATLNGTDNNSANVIWSITHRNDVILQKVNYWIHAVFVKLVPCFLLMLFSILLIKTLRDADKRRYGMTMNNTLTSRSQRTTRMLLCVVVLSFITETPHGILLLFSGLDPNFFRNVYVPLGDLIDVVTLINNGVNFFLYCSMSKQFRKEFLSMFCRCADRGSNLNDSI